MRVWIGTSGWQYADWRAAFYPPTVPQGQWLEHYAARFRTVELNNSFYRLPPRSRFEQWARRTPDDFVVAVKASRYLSHMKRLRDPDEPVGRLMHSAGGLGDKLGPVLVQLPASFKVDAARLAAALEAFPDQARVAVELRDPTWFCEPVRAVLAERNAALCLADRDEAWVTPRWRTADWGYTRFHVGRGTPRPCYRAATLRVRAGELARAWPADEPMFAFFNNDLRCCAVRDAVAFARACDDHGLPRTRVPAGDVAPAAANRP
ncbi:MAG: DUF72 domain-containing protein [Actinobacteria bacterium]|nr:DUF72 domain-containing protein [Actinomycetota bacterium]